MTHTIIKRGSRLKKMPFSGAQPLLQGRPDRAAAAGYLQSAL